MPGGPVRLAASLLRRLDPVVASGVLEVLAAVQGDTRGARSVVVRDDRVEAVRGVLGPLPVAIAAVRLRAPVGPGRDVGSDSERAVPRDRRAHRCWLRGGSGARGGPGAGWPLQRPGGGGARPA